MEPDILSAEKLQLTLEQQKVVRFLTAFSKQMVVMSFCENNMSNWASSLLKEMYQVLDDVIAGCLKSGAKPTCNSISKTSRPGSKHLLFPVKIVNVPGL